MGRQGANEPGQRDVRQPPPFASDRDDVVQRLDRVRSDSTEAATRCLEYGFLAGPQSQERRGASRVAVRSYVARFALGTDEEQRVQLGDLCRLLDIDPEREVTTDRVDDVVASVGEIEFDPLGERFPGRTLAEFDCALRLPDIDPEREVTTDRVDDVVASVGEIEFDPLGERFPGRTLAEFDCALRLP